MSDLVKLLEKADQFHNELPAFPGEGVDLSLPLNEVIDFTLFRPEVVPAEVEILCAGALDYHFASVCVNPIYLPLVSSLLAGTGIKPCTVIDFPLGSSASLVKLTEAHVALEQGAAELEMVMTIGLLRGGQYQAVMDDIQAVVETAHAARALVKVIIETCVLSRREMILACLLSQAAGADFVNTSTGFGKGGATMEDVDLMRRVVGSTGKMGVKAAGGIRTVADAQALRKAGANRLGTSSGIKIMEELAAERQ